MVTENLKSGAITNLDASPPTYLHPGIGGPARMRAADASVTATTGKTTGGTYQLVRLKSNAILKHARYKIDASVTTFDGDLGFYYSTSTVDGTPPALQGTKVNSTTGAQILGAAIDLHTAANFVDACGTITAAKLDMPLWQLCGLTVDPGGYFDLTLTNTSTTSGAPVFYLEAEWVDDPG